jgi:hypothetical protein
MSTQSSPLTLLTLASSLVLGLSSVASAQTPLVTDGSEQTLNHTGALVDFTIPNPSTVNAIRLMTKGGDGGDADTSNCGSDGGLSARVQASFSIGTLSTDDLAPGGTLRFIVGDHGHDGYKPNQSGASGGGGGGTGILYLPPGLDPTVVANWEILLVGGGGGGAHQGEFLWMCPDGVDGGDASLTTTGGDAEGANSGNGGSNGADGGHSSEGNGGEGYISAGITGNSQPGNYGFGFGAGGDDAIFENCGGGGGERWIWFNG